MNLFKNIFKGLFKDDFEAKNSEIVSLQQSFLNLGNVVKEKESQISRLEVVAKSLGEKIDESNLNIRRLNDELSSSKRQLVVALNSYANERQAKIDLEARIDSFKQKEARAKEESKKRERELMTVIKESESVKAELAKLKDEKKSLQIKLKNSQKTYSNEITTLKTENRNLSDSITTLQNDKVKLEISSKEKNKTIENLEDSIKATVQENSAKTSELQTKLAIANQSLTDKLSEIADLNDTISTIRNEAKDEQSTLVASLQDSRSALESKTQECENLKRLLESTKSESQEKTSSLAASLQDLQNELECKTQECENLKQRLNLAKNADSETFIALKNDFSSKQEEISNLELTIQTLNESISDLRSANEALESDLSKKHEECSNLKSSLESLSDTAAHVLETERQLAESRDEIESLKARLQTLPSEIELIRRDKEIERLERKVNDLESQLKSYQSSPKEIPNTDKQEHLVILGQKRHTPARVRPVYKKPVFPYVDGPFASFYGEILKTKDFPKIENDNIYAISRRLIDVVYDCRTNKLVSSDSIFLKWSAEEISHLRFELDEAVRTNEPYLICPCCHQMVIISSRSVGFGKDSREVQYFKHAVNNIPCDLKRDYTYGVTIDGVETGIIDRPAYLKDLKSIICDALKSEISSSMGITDVEVSNWVFSNELPIMKRRLADLTASYKGHDIVFELVTPTTNSSKLHDRDIFYLINNRQVFWILGLNSKADYSELRRSVAKDIMFTNRRNVFVFDIEAQEETRKRGELMLKCNWLDENDEWYYQVEKNGKNGKCISLSQITFDDDSCRPFYHDADEDFFQKHPSDERPLKLSREELKKSIIDRWNYGVAIEKAKKEIDESGTGIEAFYNGEKWGFRYGSLIFIEPIFTEEPVIKGNLAKVCDNENFGIVNRSGSIILPARYQNVEILPNESVLYSEKDEWHIFGIIDPLASYDSKDSIKIDTISQDSRVFHLVIYKHLFQGQMPEEFYFSGEQIFKKDKFIDKWVLWCSNGVKINGMSWNSVEITNDSQLKLIDGDHIIYLSTDGAVKEETIIKRRHYLVRDPLVNGNYIVKNIRGYWGIVDKQDKDILTPQYDIIETLDKKYLRFQLNGKWGVIDLDGNIVIEAKYYSIESVCDEGFNVSIPDPEKPWEYLHGKIDYNGNNIREIVSELYNDMYISKSFERYGVESHNGVILQHSYKSLFYWDKFKFIAKKNGNLGIIDINGAVLLPFEYSEISPLKDGRSLVHKGTKIFHINADCKIIEDEIIRLQQGYKKIKKEGKWGIISPKGEELVPCKYDDITTFRGRLIGIINGHLIKLSAYYPFLLQMSGVYSKIGGKDLIKVSTFTFQLCPKATDIDLNSKIDVALINWTNAMKYPVVSLALPSRLTKMRDLVDRNERFCIGETIEGQIVSFKRKKNKTTKQFKFKYADVLTTAGVKVRVHIEDFYRSKISLESTSIDTKLCLTKIGYNEELDRTIWRVATC